MATKKLLGAAARAQAYLERAERENLEEAARCEALPSQHVAIVGGGTMGSGIARALLDAGMEVVLLEKDQASLDRAITRIRGGYTRSVQKGRLDVGLVKDRMRKCRFTLDYQDLSHAALVIEAVFEQMSHKEEVFRALDNVCRRDAILASNTSFLDIDQIASFTNRPEYVVGLHFFSPAHVMRMVEIVRGNQTSQVVLRQCRNLVASMGKLGVVAGVCDGFIGNRMLTRYLVAAHQLVVEGAAPEHVDETVEAFGFAMGPFRMQDLAGLDIGHANRMRYRHEAPEKWFPHIGDLLVEKGRLGQKTGSGWYRYEDGLVSPIVDASTQDVITEFRRAHGVSSRPVSSDEILERCLYPLINEGAALLEEGIARCASDIDLLYVNGYGFPRAKGGPMFHADAIGHPGCLADAGARRGRDGS